MQYVNDDMDELFRSAAEDYPLQVKGADWNKVAWALENEGETMPREKKRGNRNLVWLLCLMPVLFCNKDFTSTSHHATRPGNELISVIPVTDERPGKSDVTSIDLHKQELTVVSNPGETSKATAKLPGINGSTSIQSDHRLMTTSPRNKFLPSLNDNRKQNNSLTDFPAVSITSDEKIGDKSSVDKSLVNTDEPATRKSTESIKAANPASETTTTKPAEKPLDEKAASPRNKDSNKKFYAVLLGGLDVSSVRLQKVEHAGRHYGGLLGYKLNKRWSLETGFIVEKKYYYTEGQYFNTSAIYMPPNSKITEVTGDCNMFELPLTARYDFARNKNSSWFASAGLSSYLMKKEHYDYLYYYGNSNTQANHEKTYKNESTNLFSVLHLSAGFSRKIDKTISIRFEPYLKLPVSGIGFGKLPLVSTGVNVGIVKSLF